MELKRITSFSINHDVLQKGMYTSRIDGDVVTYDVRMKVPNKGDYLSTGGMHAMEHLMATYCRNSAFTDNTIYVGPMGCRTGFYMLFRGLTDEQAIQLVKDSLKFTAEWEGTVPGATCSRECGNYLDMNLPEAKAVAADMLEVLKNWTPADLKYKE